MEREGDVRHFCSTSLLLLLVLFSPLGGTVVVCVNVVCAHFQAHTDVLFEAFLFIFLLSFLRLVCVFIQSVT